MNSFHKRKVTARRKEKESRVRAVAKCADRLGNRIRRGREHLGASAGKDACPFFYLLDFLLGTKKWQALQGFRTRACSRGYSAEVCYAVIIVYKYKLHELMWSRCCIMYYIQVYILSDEEMCGRWLCTRKRNLSLWPIFYVQIRLLVSYQKTKKKKKQDKKIVGTLNAFCSFLVIFYWTGQGCWMQLRGGTIFFGL